MRFAGGADSAAGFAGGGCAVGCGAGAGGVGRERESGGVLVVVLGEKDVGVVGEEKGCLRIGWAGCGYWSWSWRGSLPVG